LKKVVVACCAILLGLGCASALSAPLRSGVEKLFNNRVAPRPPRNGIPNVKQPNRSTAIAPLPRSRPADATPPASAVAPTSGPIVFPPVAPLE